MFNIFISSEKTNQQNDFMTQIQNCAVLNHYYELKTEIEWNFNYEKKNIT